MSSSFSAKLREEAAARLREENSISRAAKNALSYTPTVTATANGITFGGGYRSSVNVSDSDDDGEGYDIEPTTNIYRRETAPTTSKVSAQVRKDAIDQVRKDVLSDMVDSMPRPSSSSSSKTPRDPIIPPSSSSSSSSNDGPIWLSTDDSVDSKPYPPSSRGPRLNRPDVSAAHEEDFQATKQINELKKNLAKTEKDKRLAEVQANIQAKEKADEMRTELERKERELAAMVFIVVKLRMRIFNLKSPILFHIDFREIVQP